MAAAIAPMYAWNQELHHEGPYFHNDPSGFSELLDDQGLMEPQEYKYPQPDCHGNINVIISHPAADSRDPMTSRSDCDLTICALPSQPPPPPPPPPPLPPSNAPMLTNEVPVEIRNFFEEMLDSEPGPMTFDTPAHLEDHEQQSFVENTPTSTVAPVCAWSPMPPSRPYSSMPSLPLTHDSPTQGVSEPVALFEEQVLDFNKELTTSKLLNRRRRRKKQAATPVHVPQPIRATTSQNLTDTLDLKPPMSARAAATAVSGMDHLASEAIERPHSLPETNPSVSVPLFFHFAPLSMSYNCFSDLSSSRTSPSPSCSSHQPVMDFSRAAVTNNTRETHCSNSFIAFTERPGDVSSVDGAKPKRPKASRRYVCHICHRAFRRDFPRHMRTHEEHARFVCPFPRDDCPHKRGQFNRPYDFKNHLLHSHFEFDDESEVRNLHHLHAKLERSGTCACGAHFLAKDWLEIHVTGPDRCPLLRSY